MTTPDPAAIAINLTVIGEMCLLKCDGFVGGWVIEEMIELGLIEGNDDDGYKRTELGDKVLLCIEGG